MSDVPEGYKMSDVGVIPEDWSISELVDLCSKLNVGFVGVCEPYYTDEANGILLIRTGNLQENDFVLEGSRFVTKEFHQRNRKSQVVAGDVLIARHGSSGNALIVPDYVKEANTLNIVILRIDENKVSNYYSVYAINSTAVKNQVYNFTAGSTQGVINTKAIAKLKIPLPPTKAEQTAIAIALNDTDVLITQLEKLIAKKRNIKQGTMQQLLTGEKRLPGFSGEWEVRKLGEIFKITVGGDFKEQYSSNDEDEMHCYPIYSNSVSNRGLYGYSTYFVYEANSITVTARGTIGVANMRNHEFVAIGRVLILQPDYPIDCFFMSEFINNRIDFVIETTGVPQLTAPQISLYEVLFPSLSEQITIAQILSDMDTEIEALGQKQAKYKAIKQGMMQELLTGKTRLAKEDKT